MKNLILIWFLGSLIPYAQLKQELKEYEVIPGTTGNQIVLSITNNTDIRILENIAVKLLKGSENLEFPVKEITLGSISGSEEKEALFSFNVNYNAYITAQDTLVYLITDNKTIYHTRQFLLNYSMPTEYKLEQNFPNPFNPATAIRYTIPFNSNVKILVYNILGEVVSELVNTVQGVGYHEVVLNANNLASGVYIYSIQAKSVDSGKDFSSIKKMMLIK